MKRLRVAVIGCGSIGRRHLRNLRRLGCEALSAFDPSPAAREHLAGLPGVTVAAHLDEIWAGRPDAVIVATPPHLHVQVAMEAAVRGAALFIEKPLSHCGADLSQLIDRVADSQLTTMVGCNMRFHPGPALIQRLLGQGVIGDVLAARIETGSYLPAWRPESDYRESYSANAARGGGAVLDCIHEIDLALWYLGPATLRAAVVRPATSIGLTAPGLAELLLTHSSGALSSVHLNFVQRDYHRACRIVGTTGTLSWSFEVPRVTLRRGDAADDFPFSPGWELNDMYVEEMQEFLAAVASGRPTSCPLEQGAAALVIACGAVSGDAQW